MCYSKNMKSVYHQKIVISLLCTLLFLSAAVQAPALDLEELEWGFEFRRAGVEDSNIQDASAAVWTNAFGLRFPLRFSGTSFSYVPGLNFARLYFAYDDSAERGIPTDMERHDLTAITVMLDSNFRWDFIRGKTATYSAEAGFGLYLPIPLKSWSDSSGDILPSLYSSGKFFLPSSALQVSWKLYKDIRLITRFASYFPVYHLWGGEVLPFSDGLLLGLSVGLTI